MRRAALLCLLAAPAAAASFLPAAPLDFQRPAEVLSEHCRDARKRADMALQAIAARPESALSFTDTVEALDRTLWDLSDETASDVFAKYVSVSSAARAAGNDCETLLGQYAVEVFSREDLYRAVTAYAARREPLAGEAKRLLEKTLLDFKRNGLGLPKERRERVQAVKKRLVDLEARFGRNVNEVKDSALFTRQELEGLPEDYVARLAREGDLYRVTVQYPDYFPFMDNAKDPAARRRLETLFNNRAAKENLPLAREILSLRQEAARLLGYPSHAHYVLEDRMAKDPESVRRFLNRLVKKLKPLAREELKVMRELKKAELGAKSDGVIRLWDWRYYDNLLMKTRYEVDKEKIKEYFPADLVTSGMLEVYQKLLSLKFRKVPGGATWHPDAELYEITDAAGGPPIGYFYMDLYPREGKYPHAAAFDLVKGRLLPDGSYQRPVSAIVANFTKPAPGRPSLLKHGEHEEVETFFHEFGHIMHQTLTKARYGRFSGSSTARDFVESPSQMLENWVWDPGVLASLSGHYQDRSRKLPKDLLERMIAAKNLDVGLKTLRQLFFGTVDMRYHVSQKILDTTSVYAELSTKIFMVPVTPGTHPEASFGHLFAGGYDSAYYGYMWSKVYAEDMFSRFEAEGLLNPAIGRRYREAVLEVGGAREELDSLKDFLGREPNEQAFLRSLGLKPKGG